VPRESNTHTTHTQHTDTHNTHTHTHNTHVFCKGACLFQNASISMCLRAMVYLCVCVDACYSSAFCKNTQRSCKDTYFFNFLLVKDTYFFYFLLVNMTERCLHHPANLETQVRPIKKKKLLEQQKCTSSIYFARRKRWGVLNTPAAPAFAVRKCLPGATLLVYVAFSTSV